jgi:hypothetical protein
MNSINKQTNPLKYTLSIVPRYSTTVMSATIRTKTNNVIENFTFSAINKNGISLISLDGFTPIENAKYEMILTGDNGIIWQGQICLLA